jgi:hypothetical protein
MEVVTNADITVDASRLKSTLERLSPAVDETVSVVMGLPLSWFVPAYFQWLSRPNAGFVAHTECHPGHQKMPRHFEAGGSNQYAKVGP